MARRVATKKFNRVRPTIIGAGITEQWYFTHLQHIFGLKMKVCPRFFGQEDIHALEKRIQQVLNDEGFAVVVFDADVTTWDDKEKARLVKLKSKYAENKNVVLCDSLPSIEFWFLIHYVNTTRTFRTSKDVIIQLKKYITNFDKNESFLKNEKWVRDMSADGRLESAFKRARDNSDGGSYSNVWKAFASLGMDFK